MNRALATLRSKQRLPSLQSTSRAQSDAATDCGVHQEMNEMKAETFQFIRNKMEFDKTFSFLFLVLAGAHIGLGFVEKSPLDHVIWIVAFWLAISSGFFTRYLHSRKILTMENESAKDLL